MYSPILWAGWVRLQTEAWRAKLSFSIYNDENTDSDRQGGPLWPALFSIFVMEMQNSFVAPLGMNNTLS